MCPHVQSLWLITGFPLQRVAANREVTEPRVPFGKVEVTMPWLTAMEYLCHK
jgi:hypothetical protein